MKKNHNTISQKNLNTGNYALLIYSFMFFILNFILLFGNRGNKSIGLIFTLLPVLFFSLISVYKSFDYLKTNIYFLVWGVFSISIGISEVMNLNYPTSILLFLLPFTFIYFSNKLSDIIFVITSGLFPIVLMVVAGVLMGHNFNSNSIGITTSGFFVAFTAYVIINEIKFTAILYPIVSLTILRLLFIINSRTSQLIFLTTLLFYIAISTYKLTKKHKSLINKNKYIIFILILIVFILSFLSVKLIFNSITSTKWRPDDISTGRFDIWKTTIENATFFGHNYDWYETSGLFEAYGPHNFFIGVLGYNGLLGLILGLCTFGLFVFKAIKEFFKDPSEINSVTLLFLLAAMVKGLTEALLINSFLETFSVFIFIFVFSKVKRDIIPIKISEKHRKLINYYLLVGLILTMLFSITGGDIGYLKEFIKSYI